MSSAQSKLYCNIRTHNKQDISYSVNVVSRTHAAPANVMCCRTITYYTMYYRQCYAKK